MKADQKSKIVDEIVQYLDPDTRVWYEDRGIPYRRGYLFHGTPGCGKSSLAMALAGNFKLDVYMLSLLDPYINDNVLESLVHSLQPRSMLLLEDVDSAGIGREPALRAGQQNVNVKLSKMVV